MRVVVITLRPLLRDIIITLLQSRVPAVVVADLPERTRLGQIKQLAPDIVILGLRSGENDRIGRQYLAKLPNAKVATISNDGREAVVYLAPARRIVLHSVSLEALDKFLAMERRN